MVRKHGLARKVYVLPAGRGDVAWWGGGLRGSQDDGEGGEGVWGLQDDGEGVRGLQDGVGITW